jgi:His/Glu/Gln/Arg/opine family amino acid ABC transporter permease subunit
MTTRHRLLLWLALVAAAAAAVYVVIVYVVDWPDWAEPVARFIITEGLPNTLLISSIAVVGSIVIGVTLGTLLTIKFAPSRILIRGYVEVFRGLPILVTVLIVYLGLPALTQTLKFSALMGAAIALVFWGSAQVAEATRGAVQSIPREQHEAASALGFGWVGTHGFVILPQALRRLLPPLVGLLVNIIQNSTLAAAIGGTAQELELLGASRSQVERLTFFEPIGIGEIHAIEIFGGVMILFFLISFPLTRLGAYLEKRLV